MHSVFLQSPLRTFVLTVFVLAIAPLATSSECTKNGFKCTGKNKYRTCTDGKVNATIAEGTCTGTDICSDLCNSLKPCTTNPCPVTCEKSSNVPKPGVPYEYYECLVGVKGVITITEKFCAENTLFYAEAEECLDKAPTTTTQSTSTTSQSTSTTSQSTSTTPKPFTCTQRGRFPHPTDCNKYYSCSANFGGSFTLYEMKCPIRAFFNINTKFCCYDSRFCVTGGKSAVL